MKNFLLVSFFVKSFLLGNTLPASKPNLLIKNSLNAAESVESSLPVAKYFDQDIDHTGVKGGTFKQLYYESLCEEEDENNLKFLFVGGESALSTGSVVMNYMSQLADQFLADKYALEHRFYGQSQPFNNLTTDSLKYLTIEQSLEDIKNFIDFINSNTPNEHNKWILFGGSYAGNLAIWARMKYSDHIFGVVASSAPAQARFNFQEYLESVSKIIETKDDQCSSIINKAMTTLVHTFTTMVGKETLKSKFRMCEHPYNQFDKYSLTSFIVDIFTDAVEFNTKTPTGDRISFLCKNLKSRKGDDLDKLSSLVADHYAVGSDCFNYNYNSNNILFKNEIIGYSFERQWYYQKCTELGYFQTTGSNKQPFAHALPLLYYTKLCKDAFGTSFTEKTIRESVEKTNSIYNVKEISNIPNIILVHGSSDPWKSIAEISFFNEKSKVIVIKDGYHCEDMVMASENDSEEIQKGRLEISNMIEHWAAS